MRGSSRRDALKGALVVAAGAVGLGPAARAAARAAGRPDEVPLEVGAIRLHAENLRTEGLAFGRAPGPGERYTLVAELLSVDGAPAGEFFGTVVALEHPGAVVPGPTAAMHTHTFVLDGGSLMGMGAVTPGPDADAFAIVGGTGRFAGASGTYVAALSPLGLGGDGIARFSLTPTKGVA